MRKPIKTAFKATLVMLLALVFVMNIAAAVFAEETTTLGGSLTDLNGNVSGSEGVGGSFGDLVTDGNGDIVLNPDLGADGTLDPDAAYRDDLSNTSVSGHLAFGETGIYETTVHFNHLTPMSGFELEIIMPEFAEITNAYFSPELAGAYDESNICTYTSNKVTAVYTDPNGENTGNGTDALIVIEFRVTLNTRSDTAMAGCTLSGEPTFSVAKFTTADFEQYEPNSYSAHAIMIYEESGGVVDPPVSEFAMGDVNQDSYVNTEDLTILQAYLIDEYRGDVFFETSDINHDGDITILDCQYLRAYLVGRIDTLEEIYSKEDKEDKEEYQITFRYYVCTESGEYVELSKSESSYYSADTYLNDIINEYGYGRDREGYTLDEVYCRTVDGESVNIDWVVESDMEIYFVFTQNETTDTEIVPEEMIAQLIFVTVTENGECSTVGADKAVVSGSTEEVYEALRVQAEAYAEANGYYFEGFYGDSMCTTEFAIYAEDTVITAYARLSVKSVDDATLPKEDNEVIPSGEYVVYQEQMTDDGAVRMTEIGKIIFTESGVSGELRVGDMHYKVADVIDGVAIVLVNTHDGTAIQLTKTTYNGNDAFLYLG